MVSASLPLFLSPRHKNTIPINVAFLKVSRCDMCFIERYRIFSLDGGIALRSSRKKKTRGNAESEEDGVDLGWLKGAFY